MHAFGTQIQSLFWGYNTQEIYLTKVNSRQAPPPSKKKKKPNINWLVPFLLNFLKICQLFCFSFHTIIKQGGGVILSLEDFVH